MVFFCQKRTRGKPRFSSSLVVSAFVSFHRSGGKEGKHTPVHGHESGDDTLPLVEI